MSSPKRGPQTGHQASPRSDAWELARGGAIALSGGVGGAICTFLLLAVLARLLGSASTGLFFQAVALASTGAVAAAWGTGTTLNARAAASLAHGELDITDLVWATVGPVVTWGIGIAVLMAGFHAPIAGAMTRNPTDQHHLGMMLIAIAPSVPMMAVTRLLTSLARATGAMGPTALYDAAGQPLLRLLLCGLAAIGNGTLGLVAAAFSLAALACLGATIPHTGRCLTRAGATIYLTARWPGKTARSFWAYSLPRGMEELFQVTNTWMLVVLVGALATPTDAATYSAISRFTLASTLLMQSITTSMATRFTTSWVRHEYGRVRALFQNAVAWTVGLSVPIAATMWLFPAGLVQLVAPQLPAADIGMRVMATASLFSMLTGPSGAVILFAGKSAWNLWIALPAMVLMLSVAVVTVPEHGADGGAYAWAASIGFQSVLGYAVTRAAFGLDPLSLPALRLAGWSGLLTVPALLFSRVWLGDAPSALFVGVVGGGIFFLCGNVLTTWRLWARPRV